MKTSTEGTMKIGLPFPVLNYNTISAWAKEITDIHLE